MKALKSLFAALTIFSIAAFGRQLGGSHMNHQATHMMSQNMMQNASAHMNSMEEMMQRVLTLQKDSEQMLKKMGDTDYAHDHQFDVQLESYVGRDELEKQIHQSDPQSMTMAEGVPVEMLHHVNDMANNLTKMMQQMKSTMHDEALNSNPDMQEHMQQMGAHINSLVEDMDNLVNSAKKIQLKDGD